MAGYVRKAAIMRLAVEEAEKKEIKRVINLTKGCIPKGKYPDLKALKKIVRWQKQERVSWNRREI